MLLVKNHHQRAVRLDSAHFEQRRLAAQIACLNRDFVIGYQREARRPVLPCSRQPLHVTHTHNNFHMSWHLTHPASAKQTANKKSRAESAQWKGRCWPASRWISTAHSRWQHSSGRCALFTSTIRGFTVTVRVRQNLPGPRSTVTSNWYSPRISRLRATYKWKCKTPKTHTHTHIAAGHACGSATNSDVPGALMEKGSVQCVPAARNDSLRPIFSGEYINGRNNSAANGAGPSSPALLSARAGNALLSLAALSTNASPLMFCDASAMSSPLRGRPSPARSTAVSWAWIDLMLLICPAATTRLLNECWL